MSRSEPARGHTQPKQITDPGITTVFARDSLKRLTAKTQQLTQAPASSQTVGYQCLGLPWH
ncbi:hypothetical protein [Ottowia testudinis]|uniref:Uncharacterized protein n=1 Tax=Ottowia testudinis TaxID=2816950 RepID=A0A975CGN5_9BURK|nr:hypothetical protein [Ottowia testudinis]QTD43829.1 hypothetical protein J1M35_11790 [Ottowia testudinis]